VRAKALYLAKALARRVLFAPADLLRRLRRGGGEPIPPRGLSFVGEGDFLATGREFLAHFTELGGLRPGDRVLDIGCGIGRMAIPLAGYLEGGSYAGFDVGRAMIRWCRRNITSRHPEFEFEWAPIHNAKYNPFGTLSASEFQFPYPDSSFDFAFATSLFTHLVRDEVGHYLAETARVLRPGGACLLTFFLLTPRAEAEIAAGRAALAFTHPVEGGATTDPGQPEEAIAFDVDEVRAMLAEAGLAVREPLHPGAWANEPGAASYQDIIVATAPR
jgi:SAM-dependent methyltransferase